MRISICIALILVLSLSLAYSAPAEPINSVSKDKSIASSVADGAKSKANEAVTPAPKSAGLPEEKDEFRTHYSKIGALLKQLKGLPQGNLYTLPVAASAFPVQTPLINVQPQFALPSYSKIQFAQPYGYGASSWAAPSSAYYQSVPAVSHSAPILPAISQPAPVISSGPVAQAVPVPAAQPVSVTQTTIAKPVVSVSQQVVQQPVYDISQQIFHKPVYTEIIQKIRRPVLTEVEQIVHKPVITYLQQEIKRPLYNQHIVKPPSYNQVSQLVYQAPLKLQGESVHVVNKPSVQSIKLPPQVVQPVATHVVQTPAVHHEVATTTSYHVQSKPVSTGVVYGGSPSYGLGSFGSGYGLGSSYYGSGYGIGSGYGSSYGYLPYAYGSSYGSGYGSGFGSGYGAGFGSGYGYGGLSGASYGEDVQSYIVPSLCRTRGTCGRDSSSTNYYVMNHYHRNGVTHVSFHPLDKTSSSTSEFHSDIPTMLKTPEFRTGYNKLVKKLWPGDDEPEKDIPMRMRNEEFIVGVATLVRDIWFKEDAGSAVQEKETFDVDQSIEKIKKVAQEHPEEWNKIYDTKIKPNYKALEKVTENKVV